MKNKVPPPIYLILTGALMWVLAKSPYSLPFLIPYAAPLSGLIILLGAGVAVVAVFQFQQAQTTVDPLRPAKASTLVSTGIFRFSRNPMYLGMLLILVGFSIKLASVLALLALPLFVAVITLLQIKPEEAVLTEIFGEAYLNYCRQVRRWI